MPNELIVRFVVISLDGRALDRLVHPLDLSIGPRTIGFGQPVLDLVLTTDGVERVAAKPGGRASSVLRQVGEPIWNFVYCGGPGRLAVIGACSLTSNPDGGKHH
jgi:hypothetical protein